MENNSLFSLCQRLMIIAGVWSKGFESSSELKRKLYKAYSIGGQVYYVSCIILFVVELFKTIKVGNVEAMIANLKSLTFVTTIIAKMALCQTTKIITLISSALDEEKVVLANESLDIKNIYSGHVKYCKQILTVIVTALYVTGVTCLAEAFYESYQYFQDFNYLYPINRTMAESLKKPHPVQFWFPFDKDKYYILAMTYECIHISQSLIFNGAAQALVNSAMIFLRAELKILQHSISHFDAYPARDRFLNIPDISRRTIKVFAIKHQEVIRWVQDFNDSFQYILLLEYCIISIMLATTLIQLYQGEKLPFNTFFFILCSLQLFILAWNANEIIIESSLGLMDSLYESNWYLENENETKIFIKIMMMRCLQPLAISIGPFGRMTMDAAISRMKLAYSVLSVLSNKS